MPGRKAIVSAEEILKVLYDFQIFTEKNVLKPRTDDVWKEICGKLENKIKVVNLFNQISQDRHNILTLYKKHHGVCQAENEVCKEYEEELNSDESVQSTDFEDNQNGLKKNLKRRALREFEFQITVEDWSQVCGFDEKKNKYILNDGWSSFIRRKIFEQVQLPCAISFKRYKFGESYDNFLIIQGHCTQCKESIILKLYEPPINLLSVIFDVTVSADPEKYRIQKKFGCKKKKRQKLKKTC